MYHGDKFKIDKTGIYWSDWYFICWPNYLPKRATMKVTWSKNPEEIGTVKDYGSLRYFGYRKDYCDGPLPHFGFWWFNISWRFPWTSWKV